MKVIEIIRESRLLNEDRATAISKILNKIFSGTRADLVRDISIVLAGKGKYAGTATAREAYAVAKDLGPKARQMVRQDATILSDAAKEANQSVRDPSWWDRMLGRTEKPLLPRDVERAEKAATKANGGVSGGTGKAGVGVGTWLSRGVTLTTWGLTAAAMVMPWNDFAENMDAADEWLAAGKVPPGTPAGMSVQEWYDAYKQEQRNVLTGKWAIAIAGGAISRMPLGILSGIASKIGLTGTAKVITGFSQVAQAGFMAWLLTADGSKWVAELFASELVGGVISPVVNAGVDVIQAIGGNRPPTADTKPPTNQPDAGAKTDQDATSSGNANGQQSLSAGKKTGYNNRANWKKDPDAPGYMYNFVTGDAEREEVVNKMK
jgi:hypothetical protein